MKKCTTGTNNNGPAQAEDLALKSAAAFFGEELRKMKMQTKYWKN